MKPFSIQFHIANQNLFWILLVGVTLGIANYSLGVWPSIVQSLVQQIITSISIGYPILVIVSNSRNWFSNRFTDIQHYLILFFLFCLIGVIGSEIEIIIKTCIFQQAPYRFLSGEGIYLFNAMLSSILGFSFFNWFQIKHPISISTTNDSPPLDKTLPQEPISTVPIRQKEAITLFPLEEVIFFEAYDNYSFLWNLDGEKFLCNYSLIYLEGKLATNFIRVHRKYLINKDHIRQIKPHLKGRFVIAFKDKKQTNITSSTGFTEIIKSIIKL